MDDQNSELQKALKRTSNLLSMRAHSVTELKQKLSKYPESIVDQVVEIAQKNRWLESEEELSKRVINSLDEKNKSWFYIKNYLEKKGLPLPEYDREKELDKSYQLLLQKFSTVKFEQFEDRQRAIRFLIYRGFERDVIKEILSE